MLLFVCQINLLIHMICPIFPKPCWLGTAFILVDWKRIDLDVKSENYKSQPEQKSEEKTRASSRSPANSRSINFRYVCTVKQIQDIIQF